jgi:hypothetical protein
LEELIYSSNNVAKVEDIFPEIIRRRKCSPNPTIEATIILPLCLNININIPTGGSERIAARAVLTQNDFIKITGVISWRVKMSLDLLEFLTIPYVP